MTHRNRPRGAPSSARLIAASSVLLLTPLAQALSLGAERVTSFLGQPLRVEIPVESSAQEAFDAGCFALSSGARSEGVAPLRQGRIDLAPDRRRIIVRSVGSVEDPAVRFAIDVGCDTKLRREFTVLLDPAPVQPQISLPQSSAESQAPNTSSSSAIPSVASGGAGVASSATTATAERDRSAAARAKPASAPREPRTTRSANAERRNANANNAKVPSRLVVKGNDAAIDAAALAALAVPQLRISGDLPAWAALEAPVGPAGSAPTDELSAAIAKERRARLAASPIEEDLPARLEADLVVAKKRIAELQSQLATAKPDLTGAGDPKSVDSKTKDVKALPPSKREISDSAAFDWRAWAWIPALAVIGGLIAYLFVARRRQRENQSKWAAIEDVTVVRRSENSDEMTGLANEPSALADRDANAHPNANANRDGRAQNASALSRDSAPPTIMPTMSQGSEATVSPTVNAREEAKARLESPLFHPNQTAANVQVSELSHVTDEAQVYADFGRVNEAIEILAHHIDTHEGDRPSPAPWLMMFELFRKANRRADYDRLAPNFRKLFNGRLPDWEDYGRELALDDGLEAFPHLIARIERDWGTADVRTFLDEMLYDNRGGSRLGFSLPAYRDLLLLMQVHDQLAADGALGVRKDRESAGANSEDGTPKWDLALEMIEPPKPGELDEFLGRDPKKDA